ncbi:MAG: right-handed parallel beta-helix repeat-containing protein [Pseudomonadota bacterium]
MVDSAQALARAVSAANRNGPRHIIVKPGRYQVPNRGLILSGDGITIRGASGRRDDVVIVGGGPNGGATHVFLVQGSDVTVRDMSLGRVKHHVIQIQGERDADRPVLHNLRIYDAGEQLVKVSGDKSEARSDQGRVSNSLFEYTPGKAFQSYSGGIDAHRVANWHIHDNVFKDIRSPDQGLAEHAIHLWNGSHNNRVERNLIINADRGIGFGLGERGNVGGTIINNFVHVTRDVGIGLENSPGTYVAHNTVFAENYPNAIEYRFAGTQDVVLAHNLTNARLRQRNGGSASLVSNIDYATTNWFRKPSVGDLHLVTGIEVIRGQARPSADVTDDFDCEPRSESEGIDIGADQTRLALDRNFKVNKPNKLLQSVERAVGAGMERIAAVSGSMKSNGVWLIVAGLLVNLLVMSWLLYSVLRELRAIRRALTSPQRRSKGRSGAPHLISADDLRRDDSR